MNAVSNASPLISLARIGCLEKLPLLFRAVRIPTEVYDEVVVAGAGLPGAVAVAKADWIQVTPVHNQEKLALARAKRNLGAGEVAAVILAKELSADMVLMDEARGRRFARDEGLVVTGCVGILEELHRRGEAGDLRGLYHSLLEQDVRIDIKTLDSSLAGFGLPPL